ncbi:MAG: hypothetical protein OCD02_07710 [Spirochaetaceae bacterium]
MSLTFVQGLLFKKILIGQTQLSVRIILFDDVMKSSRYFDH